MRQSYGNNIVLEAYKQGQGVVSEVKGGFAFARHKNALIPLKVLVTAQLADGSLIPAGTIAVIKEDVLTSHAWAKDIRHSDSLKSDIIIGDISYIAYFEYPEPALREF